MADGRYSVPGAAPPEEEQPKSTGRYSVATPTTYSDILPGLAQGASLEWGDELAGLIGGEDWKTRYRDWVRQAQERSPGLYTGGKIGGALATGLLPAGMALRGAQVARQVPSLWSMAKTGAGIGAGTGAVEALGESESGDPYQAAGKMALGATAGAATGAVLPPVAYGVLSGARGLGRFVGDAATRDMRASALRATEEALRRQDTAPADLAARLTADAPAIVRNAPPDALEFILRANQQGQTASQISANLQMHGHTIAAPQVGRIIAGYNRANPIPRDLIKLSEEIAGPEQTPEAARSGLTNLMQGVTTIPGRAREIALANMGATMEAAPERALERLTQATGSNLQFRATLAANQAARRAEGRAAYDAAYRHWVTPPTAELQPILAAYGKEAAELGGEAGSRLNQAVRIMREGVYPETQSLDINLTERFHQARKLLDRMQTANRRSANPDWNSARLIGDMRRDLNAAMYRRNPLLQDADQRFASRMAREEAMDLGRSVPFR